MTTKMKWQPSATVTDTDMDESSSLGNKIVFSDHESNLSRETIGFYFETFF